MSDKYLPIFLADERTLLIAMWLYVVGSALIVVASILIVSYGPADV